MGMMTFEGRVQAGGGVRVVTLAAADAEAARLALSAQGRVLSVRRKRGTGWKIGMGMHDRYVFLSRLASLVASRVGLAQSLRSMAGSFSGRPRRAALELVSRLEGGTDFVAALEADPHNFPRMITAMIRAGVEGGDTAAALRNAASFEQEVAAVRSDSVAALWLAGFNFFSAGGMIFASGHYLFPFMMASPLFKESLAGIDIAWVMTLSNVTTWSMLLMMAGAVALLLLSTVGRALWPKMADGAIQKVPVLRNIALARAHFTTLYQLSLLLKAGVRVEHALDLAAAAGGGGLRVELSRAADTVRAGGRWAETLTSFHATDRAALSSATDRRELASTLAVLANQNKDVYVRTLKTVSPVIQVVGAIYLTTAGAILFGLTVLPMLQVATFIIR